MLFIVKKQFKVNNEVPLSVLLCISEKTLLQNAEIGIFLFIPLHTRRFYFCNKKILRQMNPFCTMDSFVLIMKLISLHQIELLLHFSLHYNY